MIETSWMQRAATTQSERLRLFALNGSKELGEKIAASLGCELAAHEVYARRKIIRMLFLRLNAKQAGKFVLPLPD